MKRTVFISGSSRGIGFAIAQAFAKAHDRVILNGRTDAAQLDAALQRLRGADVEGYLADLSDYAQAQRVFAKIGEKGAVDVLINNAGLSHFGLFTESTPADWQDILRHNFLHVLNATHLAVPHMVRRQRGVIVNISSVFGNTGASCEAVYAAAKGAVHVFTRSMAQELGPSGVRVNAVACGAVETRMNARLSPEERAEFTEKIPLMRFGTAGEVANLVKWLASDEAAYLTGQVIGLDGGL